MRSFWPRPRRYNLPSRWPRRLVKSSMPTEIDWSIDCLSSVTLCIVAKRCVLEQKLRLRAYRRSRIWEIDCYQNEWPWPSFRGRIKVTSTIALHLTLNISETVRDGSKGLPIGNCIRPIEWSHDRWRHVTPKGAERQLRSAILATAWLLVLHCCSATDSIRMNCSHGVHQLPALRWSIVGNSFSLLLPQQLDERDLSCLGPHCRCKRT